MFRSYYSSPAEAVLTPDEVNRWIGREFNTAPPKPLAPAAVGDKVYVGTAGYVQAILDDGIVIAATREPFLDGDVVATIAKTRDTVVTITERAPAAPKVGDTITGRAVRETPWQRGTVLLDVSGSGTDGDRYVLHASGKWLNLSGRMDGEWDDDPIVFGFAEFGDDELFVVENAPGK